MMVCCVPKHNALHIDEQSACTCLSSVDYITQHVKVECKCSLWNNWNVTAVTDTTAMNAVNTEAILRRVSLHYTTYKSISLSPALLP